MGLVRPVSWGFSEDYRTAHANIVHSRNPITMNSYKTFSELSERTTFQEKI